VTRVSITGRLVVHNGLDQVWWFAGAREEDSTDGPGSIEPGIGLPPTGEVSWVVMRIPGKLTGWRFTRADSCGRMYGDECVSH
jgi:hypothetical protein